MSNRLGGSARGRAYLGTNAVQPPDCTFSSNTAPTQFDTNHSLMDLWLNEETMIAYILVSLEGNSTSAGPLAIWVPITGGGGGGGITEIDDDNGDPVIANGMGQVNIVGGANITSLATGVNTLTVSVTDAIYLPATNNIGTSGVLGIGGIDAIQMFGTDNVFVGGSGNFTLTGINNVAMGRLAMLNVSTGSNNTGIGFNALGEVETGDNNVALGYQAGSDYTLDESSNIVIGNIGTLGDNNTIRLGTEGAGAGQQNATYIAGIYGATVGVTNALVSIDNTGKLGTVGGGGGVATQFDTDAGTAIPALGIINVFGGTNMNTAGAGNTVTINLNDTVNLLGDLGMENTSADGLSGVINWGGSKFIHNRGSNNTFVGQDAGNLALNVGLATDNTGIGMNSLANLTTGAFNTGLGAESLVNLTTGDFNVALGNQAGSGLTTGDNNTIVGTQAAENLVSGTDNVILGNTAGNSYTTNESNNILIGSNGVIADNQTIRIGNLQTLDYNRGIFDSAGVLNVNNGVVQVDVNHLMKMTRGTNGQILISSSTAATGPAWANLTSVGGTIAITNGSNTINLEASGGAPAVTCAFLAQNTPNLVNVTGNGTVYQYGAGQALTEIFDAGANFTPGNGAGIPATFTAPATSQYYLEMTLDLTGLNGAGAGIENCVARIVTSNRTYSWTFSPSGSFVGGGPNTHGVFSFQQIVDMEAADTATFDFFTDNGAGGGNQLVGLGAAAFVSGHLVSGAAFGLLQIDTDAGSAVPGPGGVMDVIGGNNIMTTATGANEVTIDLIGTTDHAVQVGNATASLTSLPLGTAGQVLTSQGAGADPVWAAAATGGIAWLPVAGTSQTFAVNTGYFTQNAALTTMTLPAVAAAGTVIAVTAVGAGGWTIAQGAGQSIRITTSVTTVGAGGSLASTNQGDSLEMVCVVANLTWQVYNVTGNITVV